MPGLLDRVTMLIRANLNDLIDRAEDPEKVIRQALLDMNNQLIQVKTQVASSIADEQKLYQRWQENQAHADEWQRKAELAVARDRDDLAREALQRANTYRNTSTGFQQQYTEQQQQVEQLKSALSQLTAKIEEAEHKKDLLIARARTAKAQEQIQSTLAGVNTTGSNALSSFERMEEKVLDQEARAKAMTQLQSSTLEGQFAELEAGSQVEDQLTALKGKMGKAPELAPGEQSAALPAPEEGKETR
ncbi:MAG: PspA/IM30 family protein [Chloroflexi bacterium]|nr:PspA/IM30 family protein [Chloroflexota bacterium]